MKLWAMLHFMDVQRMKNHRCEVVGEKVVHNSDVPQKSLKSHRGR